MNNNNNNLIRNRIYAVMLLLSINALSCHAFTASRQLPRAFSALTRHSMAANVSAEQQQPSAGSELLPPKEVVNRVFDVDTRPIILFDGVCNLCNGAVNLALDWDPNAKLRFAALQSNVGKALLQANGREADDISSIVLVTEKGAFIKSDAVLRISEALTPLSLIPLKPLSVLGRYVVPKFLRDIIYDGVADNRYQLLGKQDQCRFDADGEYENRFVNDVLATK